MTNASLCSRLLELSSRTSDIVLKVRVFSAYPHVTRDPGWQSRQMHHSQSHAHTASQASQEVPCRLWTSGHARAPVTPTISACAGLRDSRDIFTCIRTNFLTQTEPTTAIQPAQPSSSLDSSPGGSETLPDVKRLIIWMSLLVPGSAESVSTAGRRPTFCCLSRKGKEI